MQLRPYQTDLNNEIDIAYQLGAVNVMATLDCGGGKCLGGGTPVLMYDGSIRPVEQIVTGDRLMGPDSKPRTVTSTCSGTEQLYRVVPLKGEPYVVNESHILSFKMWGMPHKLTAPDGRMYGSGEVVNLTVEQYLSATPTFKVSAKAWRTGVDFPQRPVKSIITPYILGVWLGDGSSCGPKLHNEDAAVQNAWIEYAHSVGCIVNVRQSKNRMDTHALTTGVGASINPVLNELRRLKVIDNKHIPPEFKTASRTDRLELLAGLIDTDGYMHHNSYDITLKQKQLAYDVAFIARSLGLAAYVKECRKTCCNNGAVGTYYRTQISGDCSIVPVRIDYKRAAPRQQIKSVLLTKVTLEKIEIGKYFGFELSGPDRLFLLGDFTVTHNTAIFAHRLANCPDACIAIAHRQELVSQMSLTLARYGITHRIVGPMPVIKWIIQLHISTLGRDFYDPNARRAVAGVDTLISWSKPESRHYDSITRWGKQVKMWVVDEGHHLLRENKWGQAVELFPNARGLAVTATAERADGKGLGRHADGILDAMVEGKRGRWLIDSGYLTDYRVFCPPSDLRLDQVAHGVDGDYVRKQLASATRSSSIMGDVVAHYLKLAGGKLGVTFAPDVETATELAAGFNRSGVVAEVVSAKTPDKQRIEVMRRFARREVLQVVNVDLFGEGFDLPAIEVVSMARATDSYSLYHQQFMRALRRLEGKDRAILIDHVGNVIRHGLPDAPRVYTLDRREKKSSGKQEGVIPLRVCLNPVCMSPYEAVYPACPFCGWIPVPAGRTSAQMVDGDLFELDAATLAAMRGAVDKVDLSPEAVLHMHEPGMGYVIAKSIANKHRDRQEAQATLRDAIAWFGGVRRAAGDVDAVSYRRFYHLFGTDVLSAQALGRADAEALTVRINNHIGR